MSDIKSGFDKTLWNSKTSGLNPYLAGEQPSGKCVKLNTNENPYPPAPGVKDVLSRYDTDVLRKYPDPDCVRLKKAISESCGIAASKIFCGNGSDEVLALAFQAFFDKDRPVGFADISYSFYPVYADMYEVPYKIFALDERYELPIDEMIAYDGGLVIANPNAPTGIALYSSEIERIVRSNPRRLVVIDEAYVDFGCDSVVGLVESCENLLVVQTVSKSRSLAGMRLGVAFGSESLIKALECVRDCFNSYTVDSLAQAVGVAAFEDNAYYGEVSRKIVATREWFTKTLIDMGFAVLPSSANFVFARHMKCSAEEIYLKLKMEGVFVRYFKKPRIDNFLRITIGTDDEMAIAANSIENIVNLAK